MVSSSRDRSPVSVEMVWLGPSPGRRRLRFSFQSTMSKTRPACRPHRVRPVAAGGGYLVGRFRCVNRPFPAFLHFVGGADFGAKTAAGRRGASLTFRSDSIEARDASGTREKNQGDFRALSLHPGAAAPLRSGYLVAVPLSVNRSFQTFPTGPPGGGLRRRRSLTSQIGKDPRWLSAMRKLIERWELQVTFSRPQRSLPGRPGSSPDRGAAI